MAGGTCAPTVRPCYWQLHHTQLMRVTRGIWLRCPPTPVDDKAWRTGTFLVVRRLSAGLSERQFAICLRQQASDGNFFPCPSKQEDHHESREYHGNTVCVALRAIPVFCSRCPPFSRPRRTPPALLSPTCLPGLGWVHFGK